MILSVLVCFVFFSGCVMVGVSEGRLSSCQSVGQVVQFGPGGL